MIYTAKAHDVIKDEEKTHGTTVLVDRLWPRGISKDKLDPDHWFKEVAPSPGLRKWWNHDEDAFGEFKKRYRSELNESDSEELDELRKLANDGDVTLLFAAKDREVNHAIVLADYLS